MNRGIRFHNGQGRNMLPSSSWEDTVLKSPESSCRVWGPWQTMGLSFAVLLVYFIVQFVLAVSMTVHMENKGLNYVLEDLALGKSFSGFTFAASLVGTAMTGISLCLVFVLLKKVRLREYLALRPPTGKQVVLWLTLTAALAICFITVSRSMSRPFAHGLWSHIYSTVIFLPLLYIAVTAAGPVFEEVLFRGFMFRGLERSRMGSAGALIISAFLWTIIHMQYDLFDLSNVFALGLLIGTARALTGSLYIPVMMHMLNNLGSLLELARHLR